MPSTSQAWSMSIWTKAVCLVGLLFPVANCYEKHEKAANTVFLQPETQALIHKVGKIVGEAERTNLGNCVYKDTESFLEAIQIKDISDGKCTGDDSFDTWLKYMKGGDEIWQPDEKDDAIALMVIAAGDLKMDDEELAALLQAAKWADTTPQDQVLDAVERTKLMTQLQGLLPAPMNELKTDKQDPSKTGEVGYSTINTVGCAEAFQVMGPMPFVYAVMIDPVNACDELITVAKYLSGGDETFQDDEKVDLVAVLVPAVGDLKGDELEMKVLQRAVQGVDKDGNGNLDAAERTSLMQPWSDVFKASSTWP